LVHETAELEQRVRQPVAYRRTTVKLENLAQVQAKSLHEVWRAIEKRGLEPAGPPYVRYHTFGEVETDLEVGIPVREPGSGEPPVTAGDLPGGPAVTTWHLGAHDGLAAAYGRLQAWMEENHRDAGGAAWEVYWWVDPNIEPDPSTWPNPTEWQTELVQPII
jgi:effector-binding domain-containing protein